MDNDRSTHFLSAFCRVERRLREITGGSRQDTFSMLLNRAIAYATIRPFSDDLREFAELRNAIVHNRGGGYAIAEPHQVAVDRLEEIERLISQPPSVESMRITRPVICAPSDPIGKAAKAMLDSKFSQLPVYIGDEYVGLLTSETIARWIAAKFQPDLNMLEEEPVQQVLSHGEEDNVCQFVSRTTPVADVIALFDKTAHSGKSLAAVIVTHSGKRTEKSLGILTVYDLPMLYQKAGLATT
jgi:predicted transcriptional regulator